MIPNEPHAKIAERIAALRGNPPPSWVELGILLIEIEQTLYWQNSTSSFTQWVDAHAKDFGLNESSLWRYREAVRYYLRLQDHYALTAFKGPHSMQDRLAQVSPENLELLSKLERAVPQETFTDLAEKVLAATITRATLRKTWRAYRPALSGKTARGGVVVPQVDFKDPEQNKPVQEGRMLTLLSSSDASWTGVPHPKAYALFVNVRPEVASRETKTVLFDAVAVVRSDANSTLDFHGIEIAAELTLAETRVLKQQATYCDFQWLLLPERPADAAIAALDEATGILVAHRDHLETVRGALRNKSPEHRTGQLAQGLLASVIRR